MSHEPPTATPSQGAVHTLALLFTEQTASSGSKIPLHPTPTLHPTLPLSRYTAHKVPRNTLQALDLGRCHKENLWLCMQSASSWFTTCFGHPT